ncbi:bifunctional ADP-dependent NAD(P)H-hydrate dehydratase/NAD(P)H-hydrate epimerase [Luteimonas sp. FCS-9]|uniref:bifunctional ADP-dependent NAD(P)H-hydrate dehydratase/NAD(P)H-hydrate epimerase n=1 Tax=Luteimonas sp. FCS-9 TaxID=1547516 RepID=UPI00063EC39F|nr:bifunctional ADP-dependent NAD(P)H-hydrate dehydratase/NAD(P)H-hydrate epimerase [Luteimonas sp. FCS-9]KLJ00304.1 carbohydrate kinase [Luteimonas sp. FCS-9]
MSPPCAPNAASLPGTPLYDAAALRAIEAAAIAAEGGDAGALMARAGLAAWCLLQARWPSARRIVVACGPGNNGGDGYVLARHALLAGCDVRVVRLDAHAPRTGIARAACAAYVEAGGQVAAFDGGRLSSADLVVDAVFGIGLSRAPDADAAALIAAIDAAVAPVLALDVPSGLDAGRGSAPGVALHADVTLQFLAVHIGLQTGDGPDHAGDLALDTLGIDPAHVAAAGAGVARRIDAGDLAHWLRPRPRNSHKGASGRVLCVGGDHGMGGAVMLAAEAALRTGAGLVSVATQAAHVAPLLVRCPEAMASRIDNASALAHLLEAADVVALGPGLGRGAWGHGLHDEVLGSGRPLVLDADALNLLAAAPRALPPGTVLTPHPGEAARLLGTATAEIQRDRPAAVRRLAADTGAVVVLKGAGTLVCAPGGTPWLVAAGNPGMATGGMGDALTGTIAALRAQGLDGESAAACGALLHGAAGDVAACTGGERGLLPVDLIAALRPLANPASPERGR